MPVVKERETSDIAVKGPIGGQIPIEQPIVEKSQIPEKVLLPEEKEFKLVDIPELVTQDLDPIKMGSSFAYSTILGMDTNQAFDNHEEITFQIDERKKAHGATGSWEVEPPRNPFNEIATSIERGGYGTVENYLRAGRVLGLDTTDRLNVIRKMSTGLEPSRKGVVWDSINGGFQSTVESVLAGIPGAAAGFIAGTTVPGIGNALGAITGFAAGAGGLFTLAEYDRFLEEVEEAGLNREDFKDEALISALAEGGIEAFTDLIGAKIFGLIGKNPAVKEGLLNAFGRFVGRLGKSASIEIPGEMVTSAIQTHERIEAGTIKVPKGQTREDVILAAAKQAVGPAIVQTLLMGTGAQVVATARNRLDDLDISDVGGNAVDVILAPLTGETGEAGAISFGKDRDPEQLKKDVIIELEKGKILPLEVLEQFKGEPIVDKAIEEQAVTPEVTEPVAKEVKEKKPEPPKEEAEVIAQGFKEADTEKKVAKLEARVEKLQEKSKADLEKAREKLKDEKGNLRAIIKSRLSDAKKKADIKKAEAKIDKAISIIEVLERKDKQITKAVERGKVAVQKVKEKRKADIQKIKTDIKEKRNTETSRRKSVVDHIKENLPVAVRGQFLNASSFAKTPGEFTALFDRVDKEIESFNKLEAESKVKGAIRSKIGFIKKIGELNQTVINDVKTQLDIKKPIGKMTEEELNKVLSELRNRLDFKIQRGAIKDKETVTPEISDDMYEQNRVLNTGRKKGIIETAKKAKDETIKGLDKVLGVISTRLKNIDPSLKSALRRFEINLKFQDKADMDIAGEYLTKVKTMTPEDFADMDLALKNGVADKIRELNDKYGMTEEYDDTRQMLNDIWSRANDVGFDIGYQANYFPRTINDAEGFMEYISGRDDFSILDEAIQRKETALARLLTIEEKSSLINNMIRGYKGGGITLSETGAMKERKIDFVDAEMNQFYADSNTSLMGYIAKTNEAIEARKLFGKTRPVDHKSDQFNNIDDSIGFFMTRLLDTKSIEASQEKEVKDILFARLNSTGVSGAMGIFKNLGYLSIMGSPFNAVTQLGDLGFALYNAPAETLPATLRAIVGQSKITKEDLGINKIAAEFSDNTRTGNAVDTVFKLIGLQRIDSIGKEALINSSISKYQRLSLDPDAKFLKDMEEIFGPETDQLIADLKSGEITDNVKYLALNELLDFQPIALSEVPEQYLRAKNGKVLYMLKTFTIKMMDVFRNQVFNVMKTDKVQGTKNMITLAASLMIMNATADEIKDWMLGRETSLTDRIIDNIAKLIGFSRYSVFQVQRDGLGSTIAEQILPPTAIVDNISKDVIKLFKDYDEGVKVSELKSIQNIPIGGKLYYWWLGRGSKTKKIKRKTISRR